MSELTNMLLSLLGSDETLRWSITLFHFLWQGAVVGAVAMSLGIWLRNASASLRYALYSTALFSLPICVVVTFVLVKVPEDLRAGSQAEPPIASAQPIAQPQNAVLQPGLLVPKPIEPTLEPPMQLLKIEHQQPQLSEAERIANAPTRLETRVSTSDKLLRSLSPFAPWLFVGYAMGVLSFLLRLAVAMWGGQRLRASSKLLTESALLESVRTQAKRIGLRVVPVVAYCERVTVPTVIGVLRPMILLPGTILTGLSTDEFAAILSHELAHIRRYDLWMNLMQRVIESLLFFHPAVWMLSRRVSTEREVCCDDLAVRAGLSPMNYAGALLRMAELCVLARQPQLASLSAGGRTSKELEQRIERLMQMKERSTLRLTRTGVMILLALLVTISAMPAMLSALAQQTKAATTNSPDDEQPKDEPMRGIFTPEPMWQTKLEAGEAANEMSRMSPIVVAGSRVLALTKDFELATGNEIKPTIERTIKKDEYGAFLKPVYRRFSSDRKYVVEVSARHPGNTWPGSSFELRVLRVADGTQVGRSMLCSGFFGDDCAADIESGGNFVLLGDLSGVRVYRIETGEVETKLPVPIRRVDAVAMSPDLDWLVVSDQNDLHFWRWRDQAPVKTIHAGRKIDCLTFTADGQYLAEGPGSGVDIQIRDMRSLEIVASLKDEVDSPLMVSSMDISPNGRFLVAHNEVSVDQTKLTIPHRIHVWDLKTRQPVFQIATGEWVRNVAFSNNGRQIVGEFSGAAHGALLAAWQLPVEVLDRRVEPATDAKDRLGDGIQWSTWGDRDGWLSGARVVLPDATRKIDGMVMGKLQGVAVTAVFELEDDAESQPSSIPKTKVVAEVKTNTEADGKYSVEVPKEYLGEKSLRVSFRFEHPGYLPRTIAFCFVNDFQNQEIKNDEPYWMSRQQVRSAVKQTMLRKGTPLVGQVLLPDGQPAVGALVATSTKYRAYSWKSFDHDEYSSSASTTTDSEGRFELLTDKPAAMIVSLAGQAPLVIDDLWGKQDDSAESLGSKKVDSKTFRLPHAIRPRGNVTTFDGKPIAGAIVVAQRDFEWNEFDMPLSFSLACATNEQGEFEMPPLPAENYKFSVRGRVENLADVAEFNRVASTISAPLLRSAGRAVAPWPKAVRNPIVITDQKLTLVDANSRPTIQFQAVETVTATVHIKFPGEPPKETRFADVTVFGEFNGERWDGNSQLADGDGMVRLVVPKGVQNLTIGTGHALHRHTANEPWQLGAAMHLGTLATDVDGLEVSVPKLARLRVKLVGVPRETVDSGRVHINFQAFYVREGYVEHQPGLQRFHLANQFQTGNEDYRALAIPNEEFTLRVTEGVGNDSQILHEERLSLKPGDDQLLEIDLAKKTSVKVDAKPAPSDELQSSKTDANANSLAILPAELQEVAIAFNSGTALFDLDTGDTLGPMARGVPTDAPQFDLFAEWNNKSQTQLSAQVGKLLRADDRILETATFEKVLAALKNQPEAKPNAPQVLATPDQPTATWIVQTNQGGVAILNVEFRNDIQTETSGVVEGFIVRYKLLAATQMTGVDAEGTSETAADLASNRTIDELSNRRKVLVRQIELAIAQRDKAKERSDEYYGLDYQKEINEWKLAKFDLENGEAGIHVPDAPEATPERIAELRELLRIRWGLSMDGVQIGIGRIDDRDRFGPSEKIPFQFYIRNSTKEPIVHRLRWCDASNMTSSLRALASVTEESNLFLSPRSDSPMLEPTEVKLEPEMIQELPSGRFELDTTGLHPGVYSIDVHFPVVFPTRDGEKVTRVASPMASNYTYELLHRFQLTGEPLPPDVSFIDSPNAEAEISDILWGTPVYSLQAGARFRVEPVSPQETKSATKDLQDSSSKQTWHIGDTIKTEILVRNVSSQPIKVRFHPSVGQEIRVLGAMESGLTDLRSRAIMRRSPLSIPLDSERTIERTLKPGEHFVAAHQDFEIQQLVNGRERLLDLPEANRHWVPGVGDYAYSGYLKLGITDSLNVSLHSGRLKIQIAEAIEPNLNDDLSEISALIEAGKQIPRELNDKYQAVHRSLTPAQRLKSVKLLAVPEFVMQVVLSEPTYAWEEKVALLSELKDLNFDTVEIGLQEWMASIATEFAQSDPAATREWLAQFKGAEYGGGMGLTAVLQSAKQKDSVASLKILKTLTEAEAESIITCGDVPKYDMPARDWLNEVQGFQSQRLKSFFLGGPMVFRFGEESPEAALDYILSLPRQNWNAQLGYQLVSSVIRCKRFTWAEILEWIETKMPPEIRSHEHYGLLSSYWSQQDRATFQTWFESLTDPAIRDEVIIGLSSTDEQRDWPEMFRIANTIVNQSKRQSKVAWVLDAWKLSDPEAALAQLENADISSDRKTQLQRDITARLQNPR